jgi:biopolymer transport protein TolQ
MSNRVAPVCREQVKSHWACPAQGVAPSIAAPGAPTPFKTRRTFAIDGSAHPQSVMALPVLDRITQLISTAPPSISTHAGNRQARTRTAAVGFILAREISSVGIGAGHVKLPSTHGGHRSMSPLLLQAGGGEASLDIVSLILNASPVVKGVLGMLILMSVASWFVIGSKTLYLANAASRSTKFQDNFWKTMSESSAPSPVGEVFRAGYTELAKLQKRRQENVDTAGEALMGDIESVQRALDRARTTAITEMESRVPLLGTTASAAPFIGLFGTVWGIMNSFRSIGAKGAANLATVAPGIAEALVATAIGLMAAIPAVMAYNYFSRRIRVISSEMETFSSDFLNIVRRRFF